MVPSQELPVRLSQPAIPDPRPAMLPFQHRWKHLRVLSYVFRLQSPWYLHSEEKVLKYLSFGTRLLSEHLRHVPRWRDPYRYRTLLYFFLPCESSLRSLVAYLILRFDIQLVGYFVLACHFCSLRRHRHFFVFGADGPLECDHPVLRDDLNVVCVARQGLVFHNCLANLLGDVAVRTVFFLLVRRRFIAVPVALIDLSVVSLWRSRFLGGFLRTRNRPSSQQQSSEKPYTNYRVMNSFHLHLLTDVACRLGTVTAND